MQAGVDGLARDKTRPSRIPPLPAETIDRVIALTNADLPHEATNWTAAAMAKAAGISPSSVQRIWKAHGLAPHRVRSFKLSNDPKFAEKLRGIVGLAECRCRRSVRSPPADSRGGADRAGGAGLAVGLTHRRRRGAERAGSGRRCRYRRRCRGFAPGRQVRYTLQEQPSPPLRKARMTPKRPEPRPATPGSSRISASGGPWSPAWPPSGRSSPSPLFSFCCANRSSHFSSPSFLPSHLPLSHPSPNPRLEHARTGRRRGCAERDRDRRQRLRATRAPAPFASRCTTRRTRSCSS